MVCIFSYIRTELSICVRGQRKDTVADASNRHCFISQDRYMKLSIFERVKIVHVQAMPI